MVLVERCWYNNLIDYDPSESVRFGNPWEDVYLDIQAILNQRCKALKIEILHSMKVLVLLP